MVDSVKTFVPFENGLPIMVLVVYCVVVVMGLKEYEVLMRP